MSGATKKHMSAMLRVMKYCVATAKRGLLLKPKGIWDGTKDFLFRIKGKSDSEYAKDESRRSVNGWAVWLCLAPVSFRSKMMPIVALSVTESELFSACLCAQDMLFVLRLLNSLGLKVELPMILEIDNKGSVDTTYSWAIGGRTRHVEVKINFLRELKERNLIHCKWCPGNKMTSDIFTKNLAGPLFDYHGQSFVGFDEYMVATGDVEWVEEVHHEPPEGRVLEWVGRESRDPDDYAGFPNVNEAANIVESTSRVTEVAAPGLDEVEGYDWEYLKYLSQVVVLD